MRHPGPLWHPTLHGLAILRVADAARIARRMMQDEAGTAAMLDLAEAHGRVVRTESGFTLAPLARLALAYGYSGACAELRADPDFAAAVARFEEVNRELKALMTDWQTRTVGGVALANDHSDPAHDQRVIDRLGQFHDRVTPILDRLAGCVPRLAVYRDGLLAALERAEDGDTGFVSDVACESYHMLWFDLHEELLRLSGTERQE